MTMGVYNSLNLRDLMAAKTTGVSAHANSDGLTEEELLRLHWESAQGTGPGPGPSAAGPGVLHSCGSPARVIDFEEWLTLLGAAGTQDVDVIQAARKWLNAEAMPTCNLQIQVADISACTLVLESAAVAEGQWSQLGAYTQAGDVGMVASSEGGGSNYSKFIRWRIEKAAGAWEVCFKIRATPGKARSEATLTPRQAG